MKVEVRNENDVTVVTPVGSLVAGPGEESMNTAISRLLVEGRNRLVIDIGGVKKMDSSGIESLLVACQRARENGGDAKLARVSPRFQTLLEIAHLTDVLKVYPDVENAVSSFSGSSRAT